MIRPEWGLLCRKEHALEKFTLGYWRRKIWALERRLSLSHPKLKWTPTCKVSIPRALQVGFDLFLKTVKMTTVLQQTQSFCTIYISYSIWLEVKKRPLKLVIFELPS